MGKSRARVPSYYRQSIQNAVNRKINLGRTKTAASLSREAIGQVVSYCFVAAAHDILDFDAGKAAVLTVKMNNAAERYTLDRDKRGARKARIALEDRTTPLMVETFLLPAGKLGKTANEREVLAKRRDAADMVARYYVEALHDMSYTVEQIAAVMRETRSNFEQFLGWSEDGEMVAYEKLCRMVEGIYGVGLWSSGRTGKAPSSAASFNFREAEHEDTRGGSNSEILRRHSTPACDHPPPVCRSGRRSRHPERHQHGRYARRRAAR